MRPLITFLLLAATACSMATAPDARAPRAAEPSANRGQPAPVTAAQPPIFTIPEARPEHTQAKVPVSPADPQWGSVDAPVTLVEFSDFQCPFCARVKPTLEQLKKKYGPSQLRIVWKHNPLPFHYEARPTHAVAAAVYMLAGPAAFFRFHDSVFANQRDLTPENVQEWARLSGVESSTLFAWLEAGKPAAKVDEDIALAASVGATGTPAYRINGVTLSGAQPGARFEEIIDQQLAAAKRLTLSGTPPRQVYTVLTEQNLRPSPSEASARAQEQAEALAVWKVDVTPADPVRGPRDALVSIVVFSEFQCPFCKRGKGTLEQVLEQYGPDVRLVWKDNPLPFHPRAAPAAVLARHAFQRRGNDAFWRVHDALFESQPALEQDDFERIAKAEKLAWQPALAALAATTLPQSIRDSMELSGELDANGTPHFFINGRRLAGAQPLSAFRELIDEELAKARALTASGVARSRVYDTLMKDAREPPPPETKLVPLRKDAPSRGPLSAPVVIQVFSDFQCPFCKRVEPTLAQLERELPGQVRIVWRHLPLPFHAHAQLAAEAAEEVLAQRGPAAFWAYHDALFDAQGEEGGLRRESLERLALERGVDAVRFAAALDGGVHTAKVSADATLANHVGINGTPAFLINEYYLSGAQPLEAFKRLVRRASKRRTPR